MQPLGIAATVIDAYALPLDAAPVLGLARSAGAPILTVEDSYVGGMAAKSPKRPRDRPLPAHRGLRHPHSQERAHGGRCARLRASLGGRHRGGGRRTALTAAGCAGSGLRPMGMKRVLASARRVT